LEVFLPPCGAVFNPVVRETPNWCHTRWECEYHVTFIPKRRRRALFKELRRHFGEVFRALAQQKECRIEEGHGICWRTMCTC